MSKSTVKHTFEIPGVDEIISRKPLLERPSLPSTPALNNANQDKQPSPPRIEKPPLKSNSEAFSKISQEQSITRGENKISPIKNKQVIASFVVKDLEVVNKVKAFARDKGITIKDAYYLILKKGTENYDLKPNPVDPLAEAERALSQNKSGK